MSEWIKCSDRLPNLDGYYFVFINKRRCLAEYSEKNWYTLEYIDGYKGDEIAFSSYKYLVDWTQKNTTHWMNLPDPPELAANEKVKD